MFTLSVCNLAAAAQPTAVQRAILEFVNVATPTATAWLLADRVPFCSAKAASHGWRAEDDAVLHCSSGGELLIGAYLHHRKATLQSARSAAAATVPAVATTPPPLIAPDTVSGLVTSIDCLAAHLPDCGPRWRQLYALSPTLVQSHVPCAAPQCGWIESRVVGAPAPLWTPHAVIHYGGYESGDLGRFLLKDILCGVPSLEQVPLTDTANVTAARALPAKAHVEEPVYVRRSARYVASELRARGCGLVDADLAEVSLVAEPSDAVTHGSARQRVFLSFASPSVSLSDLCAEGNPVRRRRLRTAFGYSLSTLKVSLPVPLLLAASALQKWHGENGPNATPCAAPFWVSAVAHCYSKHDVPVHVETAKSLFIGEDRVGGHTCRRHLDALHCQLSQQGFSPLDARDAQTLACALAASTALDMHRASVSEWRDHYAKNFFLRHEDFSRSEDVAHLARDRLSWNPAMIKRLLEVETSSG